jgi:hypothetical protein
MDETFDDYEREVRPVLVGVVQFWRVWRQNWGQVFLNSTRHERDMVRYDLQGYFRAKEGQRCSGGPDRCAKK